MDAHGRELCFNASVVGLLGRGRRLTDAEMAFGAVVAVVELTGCWPTDVFLPNVIEGALGNFNAGRFAWTLENPRRLAERRYTNCSISHSLPRKTANLNYLRRLPCR